MCGSARRRLGPAELGQVESRIPDINVLTSEKLSDLGNSATFIPSWLKWSQPSPFHEAARKSGNLDAFSLSTV